MSDDEAGAAPAVKRTPFAAKRKEGGESEADKHRANKRPKGEGGGGGGKDGKDGKDDGKDKKPLELTTLFFGQMPYDTKVEDIVPWLKTILKREGCAGDIHAVRLAGGGPTNKKFKGYAFVDFTSRKAAKKCRKFHGTLFRGRKVSIEPCTRQEFSESKAIKAKKAAEAGEQSGAAGAGGGKKQLKQLVDSDTITAMVKEACDASEGALAESDLDAKLKSFLSLLPKDVAAAALKSIRKQAPKAPQATKAKYFMGIVKKTSKMHWDKSEAKRKREENARGGGGGGGGGKGKVAKGDDADGDAD